MLLGNVTDRWCLIATFLCLKIRFISTWNDIRFERVIVDCLTQVYYVKLVFLWDEALYVLLDVLWCEVATLKLINYAYQNYRYQRERFFHLFLKLLYSLFFIIFVSILILYIFLLSIFYQYQWSFRNKVNIKLFSWINCHLRLLCQFILFKFLSKNSSN